MPDPFPSIHFAVSCNALFLVHPNFYADPIRLFSEFGSAAVASLKPSGHWVGGALLCYRRYFDPFFFPDVFSSALRGGSYAGWSGLKFVLR